MTDFQMYRGDSLHINDHIIVRQPTIGEIIDFGEERYFRVVAALCGTPSDYMVALDDLGLNFEELTDFQIFVMLSGGIPQEDTAIFLGDLDLRKFEYQLNPNDGTERLYDSESGAVIDRAIYSQVVGFIRKMHFMKRNADKGGNEHTRRYLIDRERRRLRLEQNKKYKSVLFPQVSALCNCCDFPYNMDTVWQVHIFAFNDSIRRIMKIREVQALTAGIYAGTVDGKKIEQESLNWMRDLDM